MTTATSSRRARGSSVGCTSACSCRFVPPTRRCGTGRAGSTAPTRPGSWGGHAVDVVGYDEAGLTVVTWGALKRMTWAFWGRYGDEAWCVLSPDFLADGRSPQGFDLEALQRDLALVTEAVDERPGRALHGSLGRGGTAVAARRSRRRPRRHARGFSETSGSRVVRTLEVATRRLTTLFCVVQHGARGVAADIVDEAGGRAAAADAGRRSARRGPAACSGCRLPTPPAGSQCTSRTAAASRSSSGRVSRRVSARSGPASCSRSSGWASPEALKAAVAAGRVERLVLAGRSVADTGKWVAGGEPARVELGLSARGAGLRPALLERHLAGDSSALPEILRFAGLTFDHARVGVRLDDGSRRLFDLARPEAGPPASRALEGIVLDDAGEPTSASLLAALRAVVSS